MLAGIVAVACFHAFWRLSRPDWKIDESLDGALGIEALRHGRWGIEIGHPVFVRWFLGASQLAFGEDRFGVRFAPALASVLVVLLLYIVGRELVSERVGLLAAAMWAVLPRALVLGHETVGPLRGDRFGYLEPFMVVFLLAATLAGWRWIRSGSWRTALATGLLVGLATAFKPTALVVLAPVLAIALLRRPAERRRSLGQAATMAVVGVAVLFATYLPLGTDGPRQVWNLVDYQLDHVRHGHLLVVDGTLIHRQSHLANLLYQYRGLGVLGSTALVIGWLGALTDRRRVATTYLAAIWLTLLGVHLLSTVALPHYHLLWAPFSVLVAAVGLDALLRWGPEQAGRRSAAPGRPWALRTPRGVIGAAALVLLALSGLVATAKVATVQEGDYGRLQRTLAAEDVHPTSVRYHGEAVDRYFPGVPASPVGFGDPSTRFDLLVLDSRDVPMLPAGLADRQRIEALAAGLAVHRIGRLEVWW